MQECHEISGGFLETSEYTAVVFDLIEETLDQMPFLIKVPIVSAGRQAVGAGRDDRLHAMFLHGLDEGVGVVPLAADDGLGRQIADQSLRLSDVGSLPAGQDEGQGIPQRIRHGMNLGAEAVP